MRSTDTILLEKAYEQVFKKQIIKENDESKFKLRIDSYLEDVLGGSDGVHSLPKENFYDAIEKNNLKENSWYVYSRKDGTNAHLLKVTTIEDGKINVEDQQRYFATGKYIAPSKNEKDRVKYKIYDYNPETDYLSSSDIYPDNVIIGPIEDEQTISNVEEYLDQIAKRGKAMSSYFSSRPDAPLD